MSPYRADYLTSVKRAKTTWLKEEENYKGETMTRNVFQMYILRACVGIILLISPIASIAQDMDFEYRCVIKDVPTTNDQVTILPGGLTSTTVGDSFLVEFWATDSGSTNTGIVSAYTNVGYASDLVSCDSVNHPAPFNIFPEGICTGAEVEDFGGSQLAGSIGIEPNWVRIGSVDFTAVAFGVAQFVMEPAAVESSAFGRGLILPANIDYGTCSIAIHSDSSCVDVEDCNGNGICVGPNTCECFEQFTGPMCAVQIPTVGQWGLTIMALGISILATLTIRRKQPYIAEL